MIVSKIVSGGQSGADRGGLDAALALNIPIGGWAPRGWLAEDGVIPERYRVHMQETQSRDYPERTRLNVRDSDATIVFFGPQGERGGSLNTVNLCNSPYKRACRRVLWEEIEEPLDELFIPKTIGWIRAHANFMGRPIVLNVAGTRESKAPGIQARVAGVMRAVLERLMAGDDPHA